MTFIERECRLWDGTDEAPMIRYRPASTMFRSTPEWKEWLEEFADFARKDYVDLIDDAMAEHARRLKFEEKPPRR